MGASRRERLISAAERTIREAMAPKADPAKIAWRLSAALERLRGVRSG